jgi:hypothetical protein
VDVNLAAAKAQAVSIKANRKDGKITSWKVCVPRIPGDPSRCTLATLTLELTIDALLEWNRSRKESEQAAEGVSTEDFESALKLAVMKPDHMIPVKAQVI